MNFDTEPRRRALRDALRQRLGALLEQASPEWMVHNIDVDVVELFAENTQEVQLRIRLRPKGVDRYEAAKALMEAQVLRTYAGVEPPKPFVAPPQQYGVRELDL